MVGGGRQNSFPRGGHPLAENVNTPDININLLLSGLTHWISKKVVMCAINLLLMRCSGAANRLMKDITFVAPITNKEMNIY